MARKIKIIADDKIPFLKGVLDPLSDISYLPGREIRKIDIRDADALIIRTRTKCNKELLEGTNVRFIATATIGFDHIDTEYCSARNITWQNAAGCNSSSVMQYVLSALFVISAEVNLRLESTTIGIIGVGNVGSKVAKAAKLLGMNVLLNDPPRQRIEGGSEFITLDVLLKESDIITLHVPLNMTGQDRTFHMLNDHFFRSGRKKYHLINTSRGEIMDEKNLIQAIATGNPGFVVLDVWENEPDINKDLVKKVNIATPHIAGYSLDGKANGTMMSVQGLSRFFNLGLDTWCPRSVPVPEDENIYIDAAEKSKEAVISEAVIRTYNIRKDDTRFRQSIQNFEVQRENYPPRREFTTYTIHLKNDRFNTGMLLQELGFNIQEYS